MSDEDVKKLKRELSKEQFTLSDYDIVGSGLSETFRSKRSVSNVSDLNLQLPPSWSENRHMILCFLNPVFESVYKCLGRKKIPQCCGADVTQTCRPNWVEKKDIQWYALRIKSLLSSVDDKIRRDNAPAAAMADEAFELGALFEEARLKFLWDYEAKIGRKIRKGGKTGGDMRRRAKPSHGDIANAVLASHANILRRDKARRDWCVYNGKFWEEGATEEVKTIIRQCLPDEQVYRSVIDGAEAVMRLYPAIAIGSDVWDSDKHYFNCPDGTYNLKTGERLDHNPVHLITKMARVIEEAAITPTASLFENHDDWAQNARVRANLDKGRFAQRLKAKGYRLDRKVVSPGKPAVRVVIGLKLRDDFEDGPQF